MRFLDNDSADLHLKSAIGVPTFHAVYCSSVLFCLQFLFPELFNERKSPYIFFIKIPLAISEYFVFGVTILSIAA